MVSRLHSQGKTPQQSTSAPVQNQLRSRPFAPPQTEATPQAEVPDLQTQLDNANRLGHSFSKMFASRTSTTIQPKLTIGAPGDQYEQEADRVAQQVVQRINAPQLEQPQPAQAVQRETLPEEELQMKPLADQIQRVDMFDEDDELQMKPMLQRKAGEGAIAATTELESAIQQSRGSGQPLAESVRQPMEHAFNADFAEVRVHADARSDQLNQSIQAKAFTTGQDIFFRQGAYQPRSRGGQELLAHELTHVVQQNGGAVQRLQSKATRKVLQPVDSTVIQRKNAAAPQNFTVTGTTANTPNLTIRTDKTWQSSTGNLNELDDVQMRELITFNHNPATDIPSYPIVVPTIPGMALMGNTLTKVAGAMQSGGGSDNHQGAGYGPAFTIGGIANLTKGAWTLIGTQRYEYRDVGVGGPWTSLHPAGDFTITRTMAMNPNNEYELTFTKNGPFGVNVTAGPTPIYDYLTSEAITDTAAAMPPDQTAAWTTALTTFNNTGLSLQPLATDTRTVNGNPITIDYEYTDPTNLPPNQLPFQASYDIPPAWRNQILASARSGVKEIVKKALTMPHPPNQFRITLFRCNGVQQQAFQTNENGGTYRVILRVDKLMDKGQWGTDLNTSMAGRESKRAWTEKGEKERFSEAVVTHEIGHLLHAFSSPEKFNASRWMPVDIARFNPADPLLAQKRQIATINGKVMQALAAKNYKQKWGYAETNPGEVVPEVFTAIMNGQNVPRGLASVYIAYGGIRTQQINAKLQSIFGGAIPVITQPEYTIPIINQP